jgi:hypothetical protein
MESIGLTMKRFYRMEATDQFAYAFLIEFCTYCDAGEIFAWKLDWSDAIIAS